MSTFMPDDETSIISPLPVVEDFSIIQDREIEFDLAKQHVRENIQTIISPYEKDTDMINALSYKELSNDVEKKIYSIKYLNTSTNTNTKTNDEVNKTLELKIGTNVMCIANITTETKIELEHPILYNTHPGENQLVSGSLGIIVGFVGGLPNVKFNNIKEPVVIDYFVWNSKVNKNVAVSQIPLIYAWSITNYTFKKYVSYSINVLTGYSDDDTNDFEYVPPSLRGLPLEFAPANLLTLTRRRRQITHEEHHQDPILAGW
jgi:hypothetical protein